MLLVFHNEVMLVGRILVIGKASLLSKLLFHLVLSCELPGILLQII